MSTIVHAKTHEKTHVPDLDSCKTQEHKKATNATQKDKYCFQSTYLKQSKLVFLLCNLTHTSLKNNAPLLCINSKHNLTITTSKLEKKHYTTNPKFLFYHPHANQKNHTCTNKQKL